MQAAPVHHRHVLAPSMAAGWRPSRAPPTVGTRCRCVRVPRPIITSCSNSSSSEASTSAAAAAAAYGWRFEDQPPKAADPRVQDVPVAAIRRPLGRTRSNDAAKVDALMTSILEIGLQEPIDVLLVDGVYYGFSGCHRYEAHQRLNLPTIRCRVRKATKEVLRMHMM